MLRQSDYIVLAPRVGQGESRQNVLYTIVELEAVPSLSVEIQQPCARPDRTELNRTKPNRAASFVPKYIPRVDCPVSGGHPPGGFPEETWHGAGGSDWKKCQHNEGNAVRH